MHQSRFTYHATSRDSQPSSSGRVDNKLGQLWCWDDEARSGAGATRGPVSHRSAVLEPILATLIALEPGQSPVSAASGVAMIVILDRLDEMHHHVTPPAPLLGRRVLVQCDCRPTQLNVCRSDNDENSHRRIEMKQFVMEFRSSAHHPVPVSRVRVGNHERHPGKMAWTPECHMLRPRSRSGPSFSRSQKRRAQRGLNSGPSISLLISRSSCFGLSPAPAFPITPRSPGDRLERNW
jgi:hypothetical protein